MQRWTARWPWLLISAVGFTLLVVQTTSAQSGGASDPGSVLIAFEKTVGTDVDAGLALVADAAVMTIVPPPQGTSGHWAGKAELQQAFQYAKDHGVKREIAGSPQVDGNKVTYTAMVSNDAFVKLGVAPVQFMTEATVEDGKITSYTSTIAPAERERVAAAVQAAGGNQAPPNLPNTAGFNNTPMVVGLLMVGLLCLLAGAVTRRIHAR